MKQIGLSLGSDSLSEHRAVPIVQHITIDGVILYYDDEDGNRWLVQSVNMEQDGAVKLAPPLIATHRLFRSSRGDKRMYTFATRDRRDSDDEQVKIQFSKSAPVA